MISLGTKKIEFLIRSTADEIKAYFHQENIEVSEELLNLIEESIQPIYNRRPIAEINQEIESGEISLDTHHISIFETVLKYLSIFVV